MGGISQYTCQFSADSAPLSCRTMIAHKKRAKTGAFLLSPTDCGGTQSSLRELLILLSPKAKTITDQLAARCQICSKYYPNQLLVAAHVKPRAKCSPDEKADIENIAMLQCKSCDALFGNGFISVDHNGIVIVNIDVPQTDDLIELISTVDGNLCDYLNGNKQRVAYMEYHREYVFSEFEQADL